MNEKRFIKVFRLAKVSLALLLLYAGFRTITGRLHIRAFEPDMVSGDERTLDTEPVKAPSRTRSDYADILQGNLFSGADGGLGTDSGRSQALDSLPSAEELGLRLVGTIAGGPTVSRANIQNTKNNATGVYKIGDTVASARIEAIQQDAVVLCHEGRQLILRRHTGATGDSRQSAGNTAPEIEEPATTRTAQPAELSSLKADYVADVFRKATIEPYVKNNRTEGLRITGLDKIPMAEMFGFRNGDVIRSVNGQQLTSKQKAFQVLMKARTQSKVDIQLVRNGKTKDLSLDL